ncbi:hypothetical protein J2I47_24665 [Fibrella sp. HMF5335]|uniref:DUF308 domain-containing protein n=1 Tax=Fibrella rubiginis TaxID=2817060 RepID=A0A939GIE3_9BACT|nr:DUF308 domain-containing protein [Fibrella rubiginis]MBO0939762.1 hypothetical protein [Fibrella rubiginis]
MNNQPQPRFPWLLLARGTFYILLGAAMFVYANTFAPGTGRVLGVITLLAGSAGLSYGLLNRQQDSNNIWSILHGLSDIAFGITFMVVASNGLKSFLDMLGFWAVMYAFLQSVQAMYVALMSGGSSLVTKAIHFLNVALAGYLAFDILLRPNGLIDSMGLMGFFPIGLGILVIVLARRSAQKPVSVAR